MKTKYLMIGESLIRFSPQSKDNMRQATGFNAFVGGDAANAACLVSQLGHDVGYLTALPYFSQNF